MVRAKTEVIVAAMGTDGDVFPLMAVASQVAELGIDVEVATHSRFLPLVPCGVTSHALPFDPVDILGSRAGQWLLNGGGLGLKRLAGMHGVLRPRLRDVLHATARLGQRCRVFVYAGVPFGVHELIEAQTRAVRLYLQPQWPTADNKSLYLSCPGNWGPFLNRLSHRWVGVGAEILFRRHYSNVCRELGVSPNIRLRLVDAPYWTQSFSLFGFPREFAHSGIRARDNAVAVGFIPPRLSMPPLSRDIASRLEALPRPRILMTFGSMIGDHVLAVDRLLLELARTGEISLIRQAGWQSLPEVSGAPNVISLSRADHGDVMRCCDAVVHHGGTGTLAASLRAGLPMVISPFWLDHFHWAEVCTRAGLGVSVTQRELNLERLRFAIGQCLLLAPTSQRDGPRLSLENGAANAAREIATLLQEPR